MNAIRLIALALPLAASVALAQTPTTPPSPSTATTPARPLAYDVVSIKQNKSDSGGGLGRATPDGDTNINTLLVFQIGPAYGVEPDDIYGLPDWAK